MQAGAGWGDGRTRSAGDRKARSRSIAADLPLKKLCIWGIWFPLLHTYKRFQQAGHKPVRCGRRRGLIGDPSFKAAGVN